MNCAQELVCLRFCTRISGELLRECAFFLEHQPVAAEILHRSTAKALSMPMPGALEDGSCRETERKRSPCHLPETPFRHTRSLPEISKIQGVAKV
jgi:hypothetical protein